MQDVDLPVLRHGGANQLGDMGIARYIQPKPLRPPAKGSNL
jgi:hypothetical protein